MSDQDEEAEESPAVLVKLPKDVATMSPEELGAWWDQMYPGIVEAMRPPPQDD